MFGDREVNLPTLPQEAREGWGTHLTASPSNYCFDSAAGFLASERT